MSKVRKWHYVNERSFKQIKAMIDAEVPLNSIIKLTGRGFSTIKAIKNVKDFAGYQAYRAEVYEKLRQKRAEAKGSSSFLRRVFRPSNSDLNNEVAKAVEALSNIQRLVSER